MPIEVGRGEPPSRGGSTAPIDRTSSYRGGRAVNAPAKAGLVVTAHPGDFVWRGRNTGRTMTYGEAHQRLFPMLVEGLA
jgi:hypothetical protein